MRNVGTQFTNKLLNDKKTDLKTINKRVNDIMVECSNIFILLEEKNKDILSLAEYWGDIKESIEQVTCPYTNFNIDE